MCRFNILPHPIASRPIHRKEHPSTPRAGACCLTAWVSPTTMGHVSTDWCVSHITLCFTSLDALNRRPRFLPDHRICWSLDDGHLSFHLLCTVICSWSKMGWNNCIHWVYDYTPSIIPNASINHFCLWEMDKHHVIFILYIRSLEGECWGYMGIAHIPILVISLFPFSFRLYYIICHVSLIWRMLIIGVSSSYQKLRRKFKLHIHLFIY